MPNKTFSTQFFQVKENHFCEAGCDVRFCKMEK